MSIVLAWKTSDRGSLRFKRKGQFNGYERTLSMSRLGFQSRQPLLQGVRCGKSTHKTVVVLTYGEVTHESQFTPKDKNENSGCCARRLHVGYVIRTF